MQERRIGEESKTKEKDAERSDVLTKRIWVNFSDREMFDGITNPADGYI